MKESIQIIAEIGVNHNGCTDLAKKMIDAAVGSGATAVKFQTFRAETLADKHTPKVKYQQSTTDIKESHYEMLKKLELSEEQHIEIFEYCKHKKIEFLSTPYDVKSAEFLTKLGVSQFKVASADIVDLPLHEYIASTKIPTLIALGMATYDEIDDVVEIYRKNKCQFTLLHCVSNYPCKESSLNLSVIPELSKKYKCEVGYSDHSSAPFASFLAISLGAKVIEKHFTLDKKLPGPDHKASSTPNEFKEMVDLINRAKIILGDKIKICQIEEMEMAKVSRKSITFSKNVKKGTVITSEMLTNMRPGTGLKPKFLSTLIGKKAKKDFSAGYQPNISDLE